MFMILMRHGVALTQNKQSIRKVFSHSTISCSAGNPRPLQHHLFSMSFTLDANCMHLSAICSISSKSFVSMLLIGADLVTQQQTLTMWATVSSCCWQSRHRESVYQYLRTVLMSSIPDLTWNIVLAF